MNSSYKIYIVLVNYNGWKDTIECLESILHNTYPFYQIIVCDNASADDSLNHIKEWAEGRIIHNVGDANPLKKLSTPIFPKPIAYSFYSYKSLFDSNGTKLLSDDPVILIGTEVNIGFAGGNNAGVRFAQLKNDYSYIWFLNNDTVIEKDALEQLVAYADRCRDAEEKIGIIGSKLLYYDRPDIIQASGGIYYKTLAYSRHIGSGKHDNGQFDNEHVKMDYIVGASLFVSKDYLEDVGPMCEDYFIYFEETDWITRGSRKGWEIGYAWESRVYHKEGASIGANTRKRIKSGLAVYFFFRSALIFTRRHYPFFLPTVFLRIAVTFLYRFLKCDWDKIKAMIRAITGKKFM